MTKAEVTGSKNGLKDNVLRVGDTEIAVGDSDSSEFLGHMGFYSLSKTEINDQTLEAEFKKAFAGTGVQFQQVFFPISRIDVYKNVTMGFEHAESGDDGTRKYKIEPKPAGGARKASGTKRWLVETHFDTKDSAPVHHNIGYWDIEEGEIVGHNTSGAIVFNSMTQELKTQVVKYEHIYTDKHIRDSIRRIIRMGQAIPLRPSGGVYFFPWAHRSVVESLSTLLDRLKAQYEVGGFGSELYIVPVVKNSHEAKKLEDKFTVYNKEQTEELLADIKDRVRMAKETSKPINTRTWAMIREKVTRLEKMRETYHNHLDREFQGAEFLNEVLKESLVEMANHVGGA